jgi:hypothetical protein
MPQSRLQIEVRHKNGCEHQLAFAFISGARCR